MGNYLEAWRLEKGLDEAMVNKKDESDLTYAKNKAELCRIVGMARVTLDSWLKLPESPRPMSNGKFVVAEWRAFKATRKLDAGFDEAQDLKLQKLRNETAQSNLDLLKASEEVIPVEWCRQLFAHLALSVCSAVQESDIAEHDKIALTEKIKKINANDYLAHLRSQTFDLMVEDAGIDSPVGMAEG